jgi:sugar-specific transcriptional regulator TrmB
LVRSIPKLNYLRELGLSQSEAQLYYASLTNGGGDAKQLSQISGVPYSKVYSSLKKLVERGWLIESEGYPKRYVPRPPKEAIKINRNYIESMLATAEKQAIEELTPLFEAKDLADNPQVWLITGLDKILSKAGSMIVDCEKEIDIALPMIPPRFDEISAFIKNKVEFSPIKVRLLASSSLKEELSLINMPDAEIHIVDKMFGGGIICDKSETLILMSVERSPMAIWTKHSALAEIASTYFDYIWNSAKPFKPRQAN